MLGCDNCTPGQAGQWKAVLVGILLASAFALAGVLIWAVRRGWTRVSGAVTVALLLAIAGAGSAGFPVTGEGAICGTAVAASRERGWPTDASLDRFQLACKREGQSFVRRGQVLFLASAVALTAALLLRVGGAIRSSGRSRDKFPVAPPKPAPGG